MKRIFVDAGAWYALVDEKDPDHNSAREFYTNNQMPLLTTNFIFAETVTLIMSRLGWKIACEFGEKLKKSRFASLVSVIDADEVRAWQIFLKYKDTGFSYTDCTSFALMERMKINTAFAFDKHFKTMELTVVPLLLRGD